MHEVTFLTRDGCTGSPAMSANLVAAPARLGITEIPLIVEIGTWPADDQRTGYGTPTVLIDGVDLFGLEAPRAAAPT